jgi:nucleoside-diphosphate-sugar epimerase
MKKILIAGATGYLGKYLVKEAKKRNYWVRVLIRKESQKQLFETENKVLIELRLLSLKV